MIRSEPSHNPAETRPRSDQNWNPIGSRWKIESDLIAIEFQPRSGHDPARSRLDSNTGKIAIEIQPDRDRNVTITIGRNVAIGRDVVVAVSIGLDVAIMIGHDVVATIGCNFYDHDQSRLPAML